MRRSVNTKRIRGHPPACTTKGHVAAATAGSSASIFQSVFCSCSIFSAWSVLCPYGRAGEEVETFDDPYRSEDRKSTRLNSSHTVISYAVFCLKKKKQK